THVVTITPTVTINAFSPATSTRCQGAGTVTTTTTANNSMGITYSLDGASITGGVTIVAGTGAVTYPAGWSGITTITASAAGCNGPATTTHVVTITPTVTINAFSPATSTRCQGAGTVTYTTTASNSTGITYSIDGASSGAGNTIVAATGAVTYVAGWSGTTTITASAAGCNGPATTTHVVTITPSVFLNAFSPATSSRCQGAGNVTYTTTAINSTGMTYSLDATSITGGVTIIAATGVVTYPATWSGVTTITATATGCNGPVFENHVVTVNALPVATATSTGIMCHGESASVSVSGSGGTAPYSGIGLFTETVGTYNYTITDASGCIASASITLTEPATLVASSVNTPILCNGGTSIVTVTETGGTSPFIGDGTFTQTAGAYSYTVTDAHGCMSITNITISQPTAISTSVSTTFAGCGLSDGTGTVTASGGTGALTYLWSPLGGTGSTSSGIPAGSYSVVTTDANGCFVTDNVNISNSGAPIVSNTFIDVMCHGLNMGSIDLTVSGGTGAYTYNWNSGAYNSEDLNNVPAGIYSYDVSDAANCHTTGAITISEPDTLIANSTASIILCHGGTTNVNVTGNGGTGLLIGTGIFTVSAGTYSYTVTDANGCTAVTSITVTEPDTLVASSTSTAILCHGGTSDITVTSTGGTGIVSGTGVFTVSAGTYNYTVIDENGCTNMTSITVNDPDTLIASSTATSILCNGGTADITVSAIGGTGVYTGTGIYTVTAGTYSYTVTDANNCSSITTITVTEPSLITSSVTTTLAGCGLSDGTATVSVSGGTGAYSYLWSPIGGTSATAINLPSGNYTVEIQDANGCTLIDNANISNSGAPISTTTQVNILCNGLNTGSIDLTVTGGTGVYTYNWNNGAYSTEDLSNLLAGTYSYNVTDAANCQSTGSVTITEPAILNSVMLEPTSPKCSYSSDGQAVVVVTGGVIPYGFLWSDVLATSNDTISTLAGNSDYYVTITDANGCSVIDTVHISAPTPVIITPNILNALCGASNGSVNVIASGGTSPYNYLWDDPTNSTNDTINNLSAGNYTVTVFDASACTSVFTAVVSNVLGGIVSITQLSNVLCYGDTTGSITVSMLGGNAPYTYQWDIPGQTSSSVSNLSAGYYHVTVSDVNSCIADTTIQVAQPANALIANVSSLNVSCFGGSNGALTTSTSGGTPPYSYLWDNTAVLSSLTNLSASTHMVTITDVNGCLIIASGTVSEPIVLSAITIPTNPTCGNGNDGSALVTVTGGTIPYSFAWSNNDYDSLANGLSDGSYMVTVSDAHYCSVIATAQLYNPLPMVINSINGLDASNLGYVNVTVTGGQLPYSYLWSTGSTLPNISNLPTGEYIITVTDANLCVITDTFAIDIPLLIPSVITPNDDGKNDDLEIIGIAGYQDVSIEVFNRWGDVLFSFSGTGMEYTDASKRWNGKYNGKDLPMGGYVYIVKIGEDKDPVTGVVSIVR
ncbi:MAG: gliding motility-associated C-terminal domain-containing protein, partial [Bacteroidia bacterium]|nr:gliding motility-associated C-terminal domain-containing protein [Bacteroidia bacterium]